MLDGERMISLGNSAIRSRLIGASLDRGSLPLHLRVKRSRQIRAVGETKMADRRDPRIYLQKPGSIRASQE